MGTFPNGTPLKTYIKVLTLPFGEHSGWAENAVYHYPEEYNLPYAGDLVQNIIQLSYAMAAEFTAPVVTPKIDLGVPDHVTPGDYVLSKTFIHEDVRTSGSGPLTLTPAWDEPLGTGFELGVRDSLRAGDLDGDGNKDLVFGGGAGYVQWWEWDDSSGLFVRRWRSGDLGAAIVDLDLGTIGTSGDEIVLAVTGSGMFYAFDQFQQTHTVRETRLVGSGKTHPVLRFGGSRERPCFSLGTPGGGGETPVYVSGTYLPAAGGTRRQCLLKLKLSASGGTPALDVHPDNANGKGLETLMSLIPTNGQGTELLGLTYRGFAIRLRDDSGLEFAHTGTPLVKNRGLGHYLRLGPRDAETVTTSAGTFVFVGGDTSNPNTIAPNPPAARNLVIQDDQGVNQARYFLLGPGKSVDNVRCIEILKVDGSQVLFALGLTSGWVQVYSVDTAVFAQPVFMGEVQVTAFTPEEEELFQAGGGVNSLKKIALMQGGELQNKLVGVTATGILFTLDFDPVLDPMGFSLTLDQSEDPLYGAFGLALYPNEGDPPPVACASEPDPDHILAVLARFTHADGRAGESGYGRAIYGVNPYTGHVCRLKSQNPENLGGVNNIQALNPETNVLDTAVVSDNLSPTPGIHVGYETLTPVVLFDDGDRIPEAGEDFGVVQTNKLGILTFKVNGGSTMAFPTINPVDPLEDVLFANRAVGGPDGTGNAIRAGDLIPDAPGVLSEEIVLSTVGGKLVVLGWNQPAGALEVKWRSWTPGSLGLDGDYGNHYAGLAVYDVDVQVGGSFGPGIEEPQAEVFTIGYGYQDPQNITQTIPGTNRSDRNSRILLFGWDDPSSELVLLDSFDLEEPGALGLWVGPALGQSDPGIDVIVGKSQGFAIYRFDPATYSYTLRHDSAWLGSNLGAFNSIQVLRGVSQGKDLVDYIFLGSDGYVYAFKTAPYSSPSWRRGCDPSPQTENSDANDLAHPRLDARPLSSGSLRLGR